MSQPTGSLLLFAELMLIVSFANYGLPNGETFQRHHKSHANRRSRGRIFSQLTRAFLVGLAGSALAGWHRTILLASAMTLLCVALSAARIRISLKFRAEVEVVAAVAFAAVAWFLIAHASLNSHWPLPSSLPSLRQAAYLLSAALLIFVVRGGTYIVRGILDRGGTMPPPVTADPEFSAPHLSIPQRTLSHGRMIGDVERLILALLVANGQFAAIAFFFAGKGLIRSKELEARAWADYLLLGSLSSFLVALVVGILIQKLMQW